MDVIALVESKEVARNALPSPTLSAMSSLQRSRKNTPSTIPQVADKTKEALCPDCGDSFKLFTEGSRGWNKKPHQICINCYRARRRKKRQQLAGEKGEVKAMDSEQIFQIGSLQGYVPPGSGLRDKRRHRRRPAARTRGTVDHASR